MEPCNVLKSLACKKEQNLSLKRIGTEHDFKEKRRIITWSLPLHVTNGLGKKMRPLHVDFGQEWMKVR
jgi:hypothetical protein